MNWGSLVMILVMMAGCGQASNPTLSGKYQCAPHTLTKVGNEQGTVNMFRLDPIASSGIESLSPKSDNLDKYISKSSIKNLTGYGVLRGKYVLIANGLHCDGNYGAFDLNQRFEYSHRDPRFQEAMAYFYGDYYRQTVDNAGYLRNKKSSIVIAHCGLADNSSFEKGSVLQGNELVCLGDSVSTPGASYADDGMVVMHELQHGTTGDNYSPSELNQLWFDEAGALNEAISDFVSLVLAEAIVPQPAPDPRVFSRWALGTFDPKEKHQRGAHRCPMYDSNFPECNYYPGFHLPGGSADNSSRDKTTISYIYPDGLGWPYPSNYSPDNSANSAFTIFDQFRLQEEIHNSGIIILGALWDAYEAVKKNNPADASNMTRTRFIQLVHEAIRHLPGPNSKTNLSPVTFIKFAENIVASSDLIDGFSASDRQAIRDTLKARGLFDYVPVNRVDWVGVGAGTNYKIPTTDTPGVFIVNDPKVLKSWLSIMNADPSVIPQSQEISGALDPHLKPGEVATVWFDIQNNSPQTVGGVLVSVSSNDSDLVIMDYKINKGYLIESALDEAQVMYSKINGTSIVATLNSDKYLKPIPTGNTYFQTNPHFYKSFRTALWIKANANASHGKEVTLRVKAMPSNGISAVQDFKILIH